jgi:hypothetical protein
MKRIGDAMARWCFLMVLAGSEKCMLVGTAHPTELVIDVDQAKRIHGGLDDRDHRGS